MNYVKFLVNQVNYVKYCDHVQFLVNYAATVIMSYFTLPNTSCLFMGTQLSSFFFACNELNIDKAQATTIIFHYATQVTGTDQQKLLNFSQLLHTATDQPVAQTGTNQRRLHYTIHFQILLITQPMATHNQAQASRRR